MRNVCRKFQQYVELFCPTTDLFSNLILWPKGSFTQEIYQAIAIARTISWLVNYTVLGGRIQTCDCFNSELLRLPFVKEWVVHC